MTTMLPITSFSINSAAGIIHEISKMETIHWYLGLRQAELFIDEKQAALDQTYRQQRRCKRKLRSLERRRDAILSASTIPEYRNSSQLLQQREKDQTAIAPEMADELEEIADEISAVHCDNGRLQPLIRDAVFELDTANQEKNRILEAHPEATKLTYIELQQAYGAIALLERQAYYIAARTWAVVNGLPETVGAAVFEAPSNQRQHLLQRELEIRSDFQVGTAIAQAGFLLAHLPPEEQTEVLITAAQLVQQQLQGVGNDNGDE